MSNYWKNRTIDTVDKFNNKLDKERKLLSFYNNSLRELDAELMNLWGKVNREKPTKADLYAYGRLTELERNMEAIVNELGKGIEKYTTDKLIEAYKVGWGTIDHSFSLVNEAVIEHIVRNPWCGANYSQRIWRYSNNLTADLNDILTRGIVQGNSITSISKELRRRAHTSFNESECLVRTETMHALNKGAKDSYKKAGCSRVEWYAAEDERTCPTCGSLHEKKFDIDSAPTIPKHPRCRCTYLPVIDDEPIILVGEDT